MDAAREASCCSTATRSGSRRVGESEERLGSPYRTDAGARDLLRGAGEVLDRAQLATCHREDVDRPEERRREEAVRSAEARLGRTEGPDRCAGQDRVRGQALPGRLDRCLAVVDVVGRHHHVDDGGHRPDHDEDDHDGRDPPSSGVVPAPWRVGRLGPGREVGTRSPGSRLFTAGSVLPEPCTLAAVGGPSGGEETSASRGPSGGSPREERVRGELCGCCVTVPRHCDLWLCPVDRIPWDDDCGGLAPSS